MLLRLVHPLKAFSPIDVTGKPLYVLGMSKDPVAVDSQSDTLYSVPPPFKVKLSGVVSSR